jgi:hypothetical protein
MTIRLNYYLKACIPDMFKNDKKLNKNNYKNKKSC